MHLLQHVIQVVLRQQPGKQAHQLQIANQMLRLQHVNHHQVRLVGAVALEAAAVVVVVVIAVVVAEVVGKEEDREMETGRLGDKEPGKRGERKI